ncbi:hypothetical protein P43SY_005507 [Pythium insidiosum]|uniref:Uncharacterized protein n=1 Tax=Pythium insidiosum TaxID=114742 RepID=A0AAD5M660_PYTIN|nr:hypothetical protein P43SY_005507 [Pythium insidiosum]
MRFFRSSESRAKSKPRFSFRRHSDDVADDEQKPPVKPRLRPTAESALALASASASAHAPTDSLSSTFVSSLSISTASSVSSPASLPRDSALQRQSTLAPSDDASASASDAATASRLKRTSDSNASTEPDDDGDAAWPLGTPSGSHHHQPQPQPTHRRTSSTQSLATPRESFSLSHSSSSSSGGPMRPHSGSASSSSSSSAAPRHSIVGYRQLRCSMTYKNRMGVQNDDSLSSLPAPLILSHRGDHAGRSSSSAGSASSLSGSFVNSQQHLQHTHAHAHTPAAAAAASPSPSESPLMPQGPEVRLTEVSVAALQTRRAFQQMVLAIEDDESSEYDSDSEGFVRASADSFVGSGGIVQLGMDEYRKFQFRLRQLEDMCQEQARKQANMEETIEQEVQARTKKVVEATEKKIAMYKQAKDYEVEREIQRRVSEMSGLSRQSSVPNMSARDTVTLPPQYPELKNKPLDKILHPRRTRRRLELLREREEQQKREMEQFREFIRNTETRIPRDTTCSPSSAVLDSARASIKALRDPHITEDLLSASHNELIEMICMLRQHVGVQEQQLDEAKRLITAAIEAREEAEETAREAVELTMELDSRLERASQEIVVIRDELRRSSEFSLRSSGLGDRTSSMLSLRATHHGSNGSFAASNSI